MRCGLPEVKRRSEIVEDQLESSLWQLARNVHCPYLHVPIQALHWRRKYHVLKPYMNFQTANIPWQAMTDARHMLYVDMIVAVEPPQETV